jgi:hypothetical protein
LFFYGPREAMSSYLFTSESVSEGHPDKVADQISDAILDAILAQDKFSRVAAETLCNTGLIVLAGEITTKAIVDYAQVARGVVKRIGYDNADYGMDYRACAVMVNYDRQSPDISQGVTEGQGLDLEQGAGDQGLMFGYACDETPQLMPLPIYLAHRLVQRQSEVRRDGRLPWVGPDAKSQVTVRYVDGKPDSIDTVVLSTQHLPEVEHKELAEAVVEQIIKPILPKNLVKNEIKYLVNPTGRFVIGGPHGDCGLTGRKIIVDTYGGAAPHGVEVPRAGLLCHRRRAPNQRDDHDLGHREDLRRQDLRARPEALRPAPEGHRPDARPAAPHLREDGGLRALRPGGAGVHVGEDGQGESPCRRCGREAARHGLTPLSKRARKSPILRPAEERCNRP